MKRLKKQMRAKTSKALRRRTQAEVGEEERVLRAATLHLMMKHGGRLVATAARETASKE
jgi:hypothetical protein